jgi:hypothetical protein
MQKCVGFFFHLVVCGVGGLSHFSMGPGLRRGDELGGDIG